MYNTSVYSNKTEMNKVAKNTYLLLALSTAFSAFMAYLNTILLIPINPIILLVSYIALLFLTHKFKDSGFGIVLVFAITGLLGFSLGPILQHYLVSVPNGSQIVGQAFFGTAITFAGVSLYVKVKNPSLNEKWLPVLFWTMLVVVGLSLVNYFFLQMTILSVLISAVILFISVVYLVYQTSSILNGGETNYILATVGIFASLYNIFLSLLNLLGFANSND